ncbi:MAG: hypothetical protein D6732_28395 [Methanobacteriota archaeon]|nr:MAG: hypothetical protein D6732_28395 [Euryarchaeota archaeon]
MPSYFDELFDELDQIMDIVQSKRRMSETHKGILMKSRLFALKTKLNATILAEDLDPETRIMGYLKTIEKLKRILSCQDHRSKALFWYELHMFHQLLVAHIVMINGEGGKLGIIGLAHALADLLVGLEVKNPMSLLTDPSDPDWSKRVNIAYNIANGQVSLYSTLMQNLAFIPRDEAISFTSKILEGFTYIQELLEKTWNLEKILKSRVTIATEEEKIDSALVLANATYNMAIAHYNFWPRFGNRLEGFDPIVLHKQASTVDLFFEKVQSLIRQTDERLAELRDFMSKDRELKNVSLDQFSAYQFGQMQKKQVSKIIEMDSAVHEVISGERPSNFEALILSLHQMLENLSPYLANEKMMYGSAVGEIFASFTTYYLYLSGFFSIVLQQQKLFRKTQDILSVFLKDKGESHFPLVHVYNELAELAVTLEFQPEKIPAPEYGVKMKKINRLTDQLNYYPRERITIGVVKSILSYYRDENFEESLKDLEAIAEAYGIGSTIKMNLDRYCDYLRNTFEGKMEELDLSVEKSALDHFSVLQPDFAKLAEITGKAVVEYLPFNSLQLSVF